MGGRGGGANNRMYYSLFVNGPVLKTGELLSGRKGG